MSNRRRSPSSRQRRALPVAKVKSPADIVAIVPYLLGFEPAESLVVVALEGERRRFGPCARLDLVEGDPPPPHLVEHQVGYVCELIAHHGFGPLLLVAFTERATAADAVVCALLQRLEAQEVHVVEAVRADGRRWWSYVCHDPGCCPDDGTAYDVRTTQVAAEAVLAGLSPAPNRDALRDQFESRPFAQAAFEEAATSLFAGGRVEPLWTPEQVTEVVSSGVASSDPLDIDTTVRLVLGVQLVGLRDAAWMLMTRETADEHFDFWTRVLRCVPNDLMAPVGSLVAFAAWLSGRGVLASHAAERVLRAHPDYTMADGVLRLCEGSVNPAVWSFGDDSSS